MGRGKARSRGFPAIRWLYADEPRRCDTGAIGGMGECLHCNSEQGVACRAAARSAVERLPKGEVQTHTK